MKILALLTALTACTIQTVAFSAELTDKEVCNTVSAHKENAVLLAEKKNQIVKDIQLGDFDFSNKAQWGDYIPSAQKYRLIVRPSNIALEEFCSLSICVERKEIRPACPNSNEYLITFQVNPRKFGSGQFDSEIDLRLINKKEQLPVEESFHFNFERKITGLLRMPNAEIVQNSDYSNKIIQLLKGSDQKIDLELLNSGNAPLKIGNWDRMDQSEGTLSLDASTCQNVVLAPGATCKLSLSNPSRKAVSSKYLYWFNHYYEDGLNISLYLTPRRDGSIDYNIKND